MFVPHKRQQMEKSNKSVVVSTSWVCVFVGVRVVHSDYRTLY